MKRKSLITIMLFLLSALLFIIWYTSPKQYTRTLGGIYFNLNDPQFEEQKKMIIDGKLSKNLMGQKTFKGIIEIEGEELPIPSNNREVVVRFLDNGLGALIYAGYGEESGEPYTYSYGVIFASDDFSSVAILKENNNKDRWNIGDRAIIAGPADNRIEGIDIANKLMDEFLNQNKLE